MLAHDHQPFDRQFGLLDPRAADVVGRVVQTYCTDAPKLIERMRSSLQSGDAEALNRAAHSLKSSSASVGVKHVASLSKEIEARAKAKDLAGVERMITEVTSAQHHAAEALRELV